MPSSALPRYNVLGVGISALTLGRTCELVVGVRGRLRQGYICHATAHGLTEARSDSALRRIYNESWLTVPDGMPLVWLAPQGVGRVYGPDLMHAACDAGRSTGLRHYLFGGVPGVSETLRDRLCARFPGVEIVGTFTPPFRELTGSELNALRADVSRTRPDIMWIGLGTPKQERFMARQWRELDAGVLIGVGAAFDFHSGRVRQAPVWMQRTGLEWLFRLGTEPRRLGPRYFKTNPLFLLHVLAQLSRLKKYPLE